MPKTGLKAFICSFSVSLFAVMAVNRVFWHEETLDDTPPEISGQNIVLFLKNNAISKSPVKKIALNTLPKIDLPVPQPPQPEIIMAAEPEQWSFPLEFETVDEPAEQGSSPAAEAGPVVVADIVYSEDKPLETPDIKAAPVYAPEQNEIKLAAAPVYRPEDVAPLIPLTENGPSAPPATGQAAQTTGKAPGGDSKALKLARAAKVAPIPLQKSASEPVSDKKISIGDPGDLNHIAMGDTGIPIESMRNKLAPSPQEEPPAKDWKPMSDSPWVVAKTGAGGKNRLAANFSEKADGEIVRTLEIAPERKGVQVASETVKNLIIPIPRDIMQDKDLTPKLAYPSSSEDAAKEKIIDAKIKQQEKILEAGKGDKETPLLSPVEEDIVLDAPNTGKSGDVLAAESRSAAEIAQPAKNTAPEEKEAALSEKTGIIGALNSIFNRSAKTVDGAKERAVAKAKAKRSLKRKQAKEKPVSIMPKEIRLSFQPNRAEISGQTLRWVQAFAAKAAETPEMALEIRIDGTSSMALQQKRLNLLHNILTNKGVEYSKINTVFTTREPNSFILRTISPDNDKKGTTKRKNNGAGYRYIQW